MSKFYRRQTSAVHVEFPPKRRSEVFTLHNKLVDQERAIYNKQNKIIPKDYKTKEK